MVYENNATTVHAHVKKILWKYSIESLKTADSVLLSLFVRDNGGCNIPHAA